MCSLQGLRCPIRDDMHTDADAVVKIFVSMCGLNVYSFAPLGSTDPTTSKNSPLHTLFSSFQ
jgi:hypothetical protein